MPDPSTALRNDVGNRPIRPSGRDRSKPNYKEAAERGIMGLPDDGVIAEASIIDCILTGTLPTGRERSGAGQDA